MHVAHTLCAASPKHILLSGFTGMNGMGRLREVNLVGNFRRP